jgi:hypothetical protein
MRLQVLNNAGNRFGLRRRDANPRTRVRDFRTSGMPGRRVRDVLPGVATTNVLPTANSLTSFGWMGQALGDMGNASSWADSLNPDNQIIIPQGYPLESMATTPAALLNACLIACAGNGVKNYASVSITAPAAGTPQTINLGVTATQAFGIRVRISNALTSFKFGTYEIILASAATVASAISYVLVQVGSLPVDVIILAQSNTAGKGTIIGTTTPYLVIPFNTVASGLPGGINLGSVVAGDVWYAETLNMRDIGNIQAAVDAGAVQI